jgi:hypothetical protein
MLSLNSNFILLQVNELYDLVKKTEMLSQILPQTLDRLLALESLHRQGNTPVRVISLLLTHLLSLEYLHKQGNISICQNHIL